MILDEDPRPSGSSQEDQRQAALACSASLNFFEAKNKEFDSALMVGTKRELERARLAVVAATEAWLDARYNQGWHMLLSMGIDPTERK